MKVLAKGELLLRERKRKRIYRVGGQRGKRDQKGNAGACGWADPEGYPYKAEFAGGNTSPGSRTEKDRRRKRVRLLRSAPEWPPAVAILLIS